MPVTHVERVTERGCDMAHLVAPCFLPCDISTTVTTCDRTPTCPPRSTLHSLRHRIQTELLLNDARSRSSNPTLGPWFHRDCRGSTAPPTVFHPGSLFTPANTPTTAKATLISHHQSSPAVLVLHQRDSGLCQQVRAPGCPACPPSSVSTHSTHPYNSCCCTAAPGGR